MFPWLHIAFKFHLKSPFLEEGILQLIPTGYSADPALGLRNSTDTEITNRRLADPPRGKALGMKSRNEKGSSVSNCQAQHQSKAIVLIS